MSSTAPGRRVAIVTGASRRGNIGAAICRALAADGCDIFFTTWQPYDRSAEWSVDDDGPEALLSELRGLGVRAERLEIDLGEPDSAERVLDSAEAALGSISVLVNNAAHSTHHAWDSLDAGTLDAHYAVNVRAMALLSTGFARRW